MMSCKQGRKAASLTIGVFLTCCVSAAKADSICTIPDTVTLNILPAGCVAVLGNGPLEYTGVVASNGHVNNVEIDTVELFGLSSGSNSIGVYLQGTDTDVTAQTTTSFANLSTTDFFQTSPGSTSYSPDTGTNHFSITHLIDGFPGGTFKLNVGDNNAGKPAENSAVASSADDTTVPGDFSVSSDFDVFTEFSLNGGSSYTLASDDFSGSSVGPGAAFQLENQTPEPATAWPFAVGLAGIFLLARKRRVCLQSQVD